VKISVEYVLEDVCPSDNKEKKLTHNIQYCKCGRYVRETYIISIEHQIFCRILLTLLAQTRLAGIHLLTSTTIGNWNFRSLEHSLPNVKSKTWSETWSFRSPCFKCVFLSNVKRIASPMLNRVYWPTRLMPSHQSHETVSSRNRSRRNQRTMTCGGVHRVLNLY